MLPGLMIAAAIVCSAAELRSGVGERECFARWAEKTDYEMAAQWKVTLAAVEREDAESRQEHANKPDMARGHLASQRAWLRYRDAQCGMVSDQWAGGTGYGESGSRCSIELNVQRTSELKRRATGDLIPRISVR